MFTATGSSSCCLSAASPLVNSSRSHCRFPHRKAAVVAEVAAAGAERRHRLSSKFGISL